MSNVERKLRKSVFLALSKESSVEKMLPRESDEPMRESIDEASFRTSVEDQHQEFNWALVRAIVA